MEIFVISLKWHAGKIHVRTIGKMLPMRRNESRYKIGWHNEQEVISTLVLSGLTFNIA